VQSLRAGTKKVAQHGGADKKRWPTILSWGSVRFIKKSNLGGDGRMRREPG